MRLADSVSVSPRERWRMPLREKRTKLQQESREDALLLEEFAVDKEL